MTSKESYLHAAAKSVVAGWLRNTSPSISGVRTKFDMEFNPFDNSECHGVFEEYPLTFDMMKNGHSWKCIPGWHEGYPDYEWMNANRSEWETEREVGRLYNFGKEFIIPDIAVMDRTSIKYTIEIIHTSSPSLDKAVMLSTAGENAPEMICLNASWVMGLTSEPEFLEGYDFYDMERLAIKSSFENTSKGMIGFPYGFHTRANDYPTHRLMQRSKP